MAPTDHQLALGARLRDIRQQQGLTLQQVEERSDGTWKAVVVGSYERGDRAITIARLAELADFYRVPLAELLPVPEDPSHASGRTRTPRVVIDLTELETAAEEDATPLSRYVRTIQVQRGDYAGRVLTLRAADLDALARILGVESEELLSRLHERGLAHAT